jgi:DNA-binding beta-propeller fold protein YncE
MKRSCHAGGLALAVVFASSGAAALTIHLDPPAPVAIGQSQTFRVASVEGAVGDVTFTWNFGEGAASPPSPSQEATYTYATAGHYTVIVLASDSESRTSATFVQTAHYPLTATKPSNSSSIVLDAERRVVWSVNPDNDSVSAYDESALVRLREVPVGKEPHALAQAPDGTLWVVSQGSDEIVVLGRDAGDEQARIALPYASQPRAIAFGPAGVAYVTLFATGKLVEIDAATRQVTREVAVGPTPAGVSVAADGRIFITRFISPVEHGEVWVVSPQTLAVTRTIELPFDPGPDTESSGRGVPNYVASVVISPDGTQAWVSAKKDNTARGPKRDGQPMNSDNFVRAIVCTIDLAAEAEVLEKRIDIDNRSLPVSVAFSPVGDYAYILAQASNWIGITDAYTGLNLSGIKEVGNAPDGLVLAPDGRLFVNAFLSREVIVYDLTLSLTSVDHQAPLPLAKIRSIDAERLAPEVLFGKQVFFNAADRRMSGDGYMACVSCHFGGTSDGRVWDFTDRGEGLRNTKALVGIRGALGSGALHWTANFDEIQDFERDIRDSFGGFGFMPDAEWLARQGNTFGIPSRGVSAELDALSAYVTSLDQVARSPFRNADGSFTESALRGRRTFLAAGCADCHGAPDFTDSGPTGTPHDVGTLLPTSGFRLGGPLVGIDTPGLKGLWQSAPYLHDGRAATLGEIFTTYITNDKMGVTSTLLPAELDDMVRYLHELDDVPETTQPSSPQQASPAVESCSLSPRSPSARNAFGCSTWLALGALVVVRALRRRRTLLVSSHAP